MVGCSSTIGVSTFVVDTAFVICGDPGVSPGVRSATGVCVFSTAKGSVLAVGVGIADGLHPARRVPINNRKTSLVRIVFGI
jgi:hypothetical protein